MKFLEAESFLTGLIMKQDWYDPDAVFVSEESVEESPEEADAGVFEIELVTSGLNSSLLVRSDPSIDEGEVLGRLYNDDIVIWTGQMVFAEVNDGGIEPWVKIRTSEEIEGWSRLYYLHPAQYENLKLEIKQVWNRFVKLFTENATYYRLDTLFILMKKTSAMLFMMVEMSFVRSGIFMLLTFLSYFFYGSV